MTFNMLKCHFLDYRLCSYEKSYYPSTFNLWNELNQQIRTLPTFSQFKSNIKTMPDTIADYTNVGERKCT